MTLTDIYISLQMALVAWVFRNVLMQPGMVARPYFIWLDSLVGSGREWLAKPLGYCDRCFAGQLAFWGFIWIHRTQYGYWMIPQHIAFICLTVFAVYQMQRLEIHED